VRRQLEQARAEVQGGLDMSARREEWPKAVRDYERVKLGDLRRGGPVTRVVTLCESYASAQTDEERAEIRAELASELHRLIRSLA
jgi:hypothetical protein